MQSLNEPKHDKTNKMTCASIEALDQFRHMASLIKVFAVHPKKVWILSYPLSKQRRLWSDWVDAQSLRSLGARVIFFVLHLIFLFQSRVVSLLRGEIWLNQILLMAIHFYFRQFFNKWAASWQNQQYGMCAQRRLSSDWASALRSMGS